MDRRVVEDVSCPTNKLMYPVHPIPIDNLKYFSKFEKMFGNGVILVSNMSQNFNSKFEDKINRENDKFGISTILVRNRTKSTR